MHLNARAARLCQQIIAQATDLRVQVHDDGQGPTLIDCGISAPGGIAAGLALARVCMAGLADVSLLPGDAAVWNGPVVAVHTDHPVAACLASQYAGWQIKHDEFFAMGSGPLRGLTGKEELFQALGYPAERGFRVSEDTAVGVLETRAFPSRDVSREIADACDVSELALYLLLAPTASQAGHIQVVARSVETALHKLHELGFDLSRLESGYGVAPLPPVAKDDLAGIGRTNDAVMYGGNVTLWVRGDDESLAEIVPRIPSNVARDFGQPFAEIFARYDHDFYKIDPHIFSPAMITLVNMDTGRSFRAGETRPDVLHSSFVG